MFLLSAFLLALAAVVYRKLFLTTNYDPAYTYLDAPVSHSPKQARPSSFYEKELTILCRGNRNTVERLIAREKEIASWKSREACARLAIEKLLNDRRAH
jgi:hypothetical protein